MRRRYHRRPRLLSSRNVARKRYDWRAATIGVCSPLTIEGQVCSTDDPWNVFFPLELVSNDMVRTDYSGRATVLRIYGFGWWLPDYGQGETPCQASVFPTELRWGVTRGKDIHSSTATPLDYVPNPMDSFDLAEGGWKKMWHSWWQPIKQCIPLVTKFHESSYGITGTDAEGVIDQTAAAHDTSATEEQFFPSPMAPIATHFEFSWKGAMPLRNDEFLGLPFAMRGLSNAATPALIIQAQLRFLIQV